MSGPNLFQSWQFQPAECACCTIEFTNAFVEFRSVRISQLRWENEDARAVYEAADLTAQAWGEHLEVTESVPGPGYELSATLLAAPASVHQDLTGGDGVSRCEYRWVVQPRDGQEWRTIDGPGITVKWAEKNTGYTYDEGTSTYTASTPTYDQKSAEIDVAAGEVEVRSETFLLEADEATRLSLAGPSTPVRFTVEEYASDEPPAGAAVTFTTLQAKFYSERTADDSADLELHFEQFSAELSEVTITWSQRTVDREGAPLGAIEPGTITLTDPGVTAFTIEAPDEVGRIYCFDFTIDESAVGTLPVIEPRQECPDLAT